jgi:hypothetical protein
MENKYIYNNAPLARVIYQCLICKNEKAMYEPYYDTDWKHTKRCSNCNCFRLHWRILPNDDNIKHYKRLDNVIKLKR